jgi:coatomer protein complex subunit gamma
VPRVQVLENATVRASACCALAKFGLEVEALRPTVKTLLKRCIYDNDDEVRDRATFFLQAIAESDEGTMAVMRSIVVGGLPFPIANLEESLKSYLDGGDTELPFETSGVSRVQKSKQANEDKGVLGGADDEEDAVLVVSAPKGAPVYTQQLASVPELDGLGKCARTPRAPTVLLYLRPYFTIENGY